MVSYYILLYLFPPWKDTEMAAYRNQGRINLISKEMCTVEEDKPDYKTSYGILKICGWVQKRY